MTETKKATSIHGDKAECRWLAPGLCVLLLTLTWLVFGQTLQHEFINFDDEDYVIKNPRVTRGLTNESFVWAFTHIHAANWHPVTWISHMLDCQVYGLNPAGHHFTSVLLHGATAILLFLILRQMTASLWRSVFVAAIFAIHPLRAESVAWVAERKDVLSGLFFMLTIGAYVRFTQSPGLFRYGLVTVLLAVGLMCKPMLVTMPFVLLLLDYWPLHRMKDAGFGRLVSEKLPLFGLGAAASAVTLFAQTAAIQPSTKIPLFLRLGNVATAPVDYIRQMLWPSDLAVLYPWEAARIQPLTVGLTTALLAIISAVIFRLRHRGYLVTGWLWYLVMLAPVIGIIQVGNQMRADRYTYLPQIGLALLLTWSAADWCARWRYHRIFLAVLAALILVPLTFAARAQTAYWRDSEALWSHALACATDNTVAQDNLGQAVYLKGRFGEAIAHFEKALFIEPNEAIAHGALGAVLLKVGRRQEAFAHLRKSLEINPQQASVHSTLGAALLEENKPNESLGHLQAALAINSEDGDAHYNLANTLLQLGRPTEALTEYERALRINPLDPETLNNMAWVLATWPDASIRDGIRAVELAKKGDALTQRRSSVLSATLAAAYAESGRFDDAVKTAERALQLALREGNSARAAFIGSQIDMFRSNAAFRDRRYSPAGQ